jgi:hypothetical protein
MNEQPKENRDNGDRDARGRFAPGNGGGPGNPHAKATARLRAALMRAITPGDVEAAIAQLVVKAREGDLAAIKELLDRGIGRAQQAREPIALDVGQVESIAGAAAAAGRILEGLASGELSGEDAARAAGVVTVALRAHELAGIEQRLDALERAIKEGRR